MGTQNGKRLRELCLKLGVPFPTDQYCALHWTAVEAPGLARNLVENIFERLFVKTPSVELKHRMMIEAFLLESAIRPAASSVDMLAQLLNACLLGSAVDPESLHLCPEVLAGLKKDADCGELVRRIEVLWASADTQYIRAFANVIKHKSLAWPLENHVEVTHAGMRDVLRFASFTCDGETYPARDRDEVFAALDEQQGQIDSVVDELYRVLEKKAA